MSTNIEKNVEELEKKVRAIMFDWAPADDKDGRPRMKKVYDENRIKGIMNLIYDEKQKTINDLEKRFCEKMGFNKKGIKA